MTADPNEAVRQAVANSRLEGHETSAEDVAVLSAVAHGDVSGEEAVRRVTADYILPTETWWHIAYADRPGVFCRDCAEAIRLAEATGAQFVQERGGQRRVVWEGHYEAPGSRQWRDGPECTCGCAWDWVDDACATKLSDTRTRDRDDD